MPPVGTIDEQIDEMLANLDRQIAALAELQDRQVDELPQLVDTTLKDALVMYERVSKLNGKLFTAQGNLISQAGVRDRQRQIQRRLLKLRDFRG